jgi:hypothetical protein
MHCKLAYSLFEHKPRVPRAEAFVCLIETGWNKHGDDPNAIWRLIEYVENKKGEHWD